MTCLSHSARQEPPAWLSLGCPEFPDLQIGGTWSVSRLRYAFLSHLTREPVNLRWRASLNSLISSRNRLSTPRPRASSRQPRPVTMMFPGSRRGQVVAFSSVAPKPPRLSPRSVSALKCAGCRKTRRHAKFGEMTRNVDHAPPPARHQRRPRRAVVCPVSLRRDRTFET